MTDVPEKIGNFLDALGEFSSRDLPYRSDVGLLLHQAKMTNAMPAFERLIFLAKFVTRTFEVMRRIGSEADGYDNLVREFRENTERAGALAKGLLGSVPRAVQDRFTDHYLRLDQESFNRFLGLLGDLSWVKNWCVDGKPLP